MSTRTGSRRAARAGLAGVAACGLLLAGCSAEESSAPADPVAGSTSTADAGGGEDADADAQTVADDPTVEPTTLCPVAPQVLAKEEALAWVNKLPEEFLADVACRDLDPQQHQGTFSEYQVAVDHPDNTTGVTAGFTVMLTDRDISRRITTEQEGGEWDPKWGTPEFEAATYGVEPFAFRTASGHTATVVATDSWARVYAGRFLLYFGFLSEHPYFPHERLPVAVDGVIQEPYLGPLSDMVTQVFYGG